jgi:hypothetical protein
MATLVDNIVTHWPWVRPLEYRAEVASLEGRRMFAKLEELHQPVLSRPGKNTGPAWGSTCPGRPCEERPNMVLEVVVLHQERSKAELVPLESCESTLEKYGTPKETY